MINDREYVAKREVAQNMIKDTTEETETIEQNGGIPKRRDVI